MRSPPSQKHTTDMKLCIILVIIYSIPYSADVCVHALVYCCCCMFYFLWVLTYVDCIFFSCLLAAQSVKSATSLSSPKADISNTAGTCILNALLIKPFLLHEILCKL